MNPKTLKCNADNSALLMIDIQTRLTAAMPNKVIDRLKKNTGILIQAATSLSIPIYASRQYPEGLGPIEEDIEERLGDEVMHYDKTCFSCADVPELEQSLKDSQRTQVILTGIEAHVCVMQTALDLQSADYQVFVVIDGIASRQRDNYENAISRMNQAGIICTNTESVMFEWLRDARHDSFKPLSSLIR